MVWKLIEKRVVFESKYKGNVNRVLNRLKKENKDNYFYELEWSYL